MGSDDKDVTNPELAEQEPDISSVASVKSGPTPSNSSGKGDGSRAPCPRSLTQEEHVRYLQENCKRAFRYAGVEWTAILKDSSWFETVVAKLRADPCLDYSEIKIEEAPFPLENGSPLHFAILMRDLEMVQKILQTRSVLNINAHISGKMAAYSTLDLAIVVGESEIVDALLAKNAKVNTSGRGSLQLAVVHTHAEQAEKTSKIIESLVKHGIDVKGKDTFKFSAFYLAVALGKTEIVAQLLKWQDKIQLNEACAAGGPPLQIAHDKGFKDIETALMRCDDVKWFIDSTIRERQGYIDTSNAILVGASFIASATFASWLQPPLGYTVSYRDSSVDYVDVEHNSALGIFWVLNSLSFYFAISTVVLGASSVLPRRKLFITANVEKLAHNLIFMSMFLAFSMFFVVIAFAIAGVIVLIPILRYRWYMIAPTIFGGIVCFGSIGYFFKCLWEHRPRKIKGIKKIHATWLDDITLCYL